MSQFANTEEFKEYVAKLSPEEIQEWKTNDWIKLWTNLEVMCLNDDIPPRDFVHRECFPEFVKLYSNYHIDADRYNTIKSKAELLGKNLAQNDKIDIAQAIHQNEDSSLKQMRQILKTMDPYTQSEIFPHIDNDMDSEGRYSRLEDGNNLISINLQKTGDSFLETVIHEGDHALFQEDDMALFNRKFYLSLSYFLDNTDNLHKILAPEDILDFKCFYKKLFNAYKRQHIEKEANLWGYFAERSYRKEAGRPSERGAMNLIKFIGMPEDMHYDYEKDNQIVMEYSSKHKLKLKILEKLLPEQISVKQSVGKRLSVRLLCDSKANRFLYAVSHSDTPNSNLLGRALKSVLSSKHTKRLAIALGLLVGGNIGTNLAKYVKQEMEYNQINKEWRMQYADADSVYSDAKTATFYAHKNLTPTQKEDLSKQVDALEKKYLAKINQSDDLQQKIGNRKVTHAGMSLQCCPSYSLDDDNRLIDFRTQNIEARVAQLRQRIAEGKIYSVKADPEHGYKTENWTDMKVQEELLKECSSETAIVEVPEVPEGYIAFHFPIAGDYGDTGIEIKEKLSQKIKEKKSR